MKTISFIIVLIMAGLSLAAQPQPKGEYHTFILKKTDEERRKTKNQEWWNKGVIMFAYKDLPRLGTTKEVTPQLVSSFDNTQTFTGRVYLTQSMGEMNPKPMMLFYHLFVNGKKAETRVVTKEPNLPENAWSSWVIDFPDYFKDEWEKLPAGNSLCRIECWAGYSTDETTVYLDENGKAIASSTEKKGKIKFLASGEFNWVNGEDGSVVETEDEITSDSEAINEEETVAEEETVSETSTNTESVVISTTPVAVTPDNWKEDWYKKNPVYKKPSGICDCTDDGCAELESINNKGVTKGKITTVKCIVENTGDIASCETNGALQVMWMDEEKGGIWLHVQQKIPAIAPKSKTTVVFTLENLNFNTDEHMMHFLMDYDGNVAETEEMNLTPISFE